MYNPPERIRHPLVPARAPSEAEAAQSMLFSPLRLGGDLPLEQRTWVPAMVPWRATETGFVSQDVLDWYGRFARGQPGALVVEATGIRDVPSGPLLRIGHDRFVPGLTELANVVRKESGGHTRLLIQLIDFLQIRRRPVPERYIKEFLAIGAPHREALAELAADAGWLQASDTDVRDKLVELLADEPALCLVLSERELEALHHGARERVWDVSHPHIRDLPVTLPSLFAAAAQRAKQAGFDGVELHYAHAYTMASFLSARNRRGDGYGVDRPGRLRLPLEVFAAVRAEVGDRFAVGCRMLCDEIIEGGSSVEDGCVFASAFASAGMDYVSLSTGGKFEDAKRPRIGEAAYPYTGKSGWECMPTWVGDARGPYGRNVPKQARIRAAIRQAGCDTPVVVCGGINDFDQAEGILRRGEGDIIAAARQSLADPDWFMKLRAGRGDDVRRCVYKNYCEALDQKHRKVTCQLWDRSNVDEPGVTLCARGKRRLVAPEWSR